MNTLELAKKLVDEPVKTTKLLDMHIDAASMLRRQHEAIKVLREALTDLSWYADQLEQIVYPVDEQNIDHEIQAKAKQALKDTEGL